jgi:hypothetical protein
MGHSSQDRGLTAEAIKEAHKQDVKVQEKHGVKYRK